jgi:cytochrome P450
MPNDTLPETTEGLPVVPQQRSGKCPYQPPSDYGRWRSDPGPIPAQTTEGRKAWLVTRYDQVRQGLGDPRVSADMTNPHLPEKTDGQPVFARMDDPEHARIRRMLTGSFTVKAVEALRPDIERVVEETLEHFAAGPNPGDLARDYALPIPSRVICRLLGSPYADHEFFEAQSSKAVDRSISAEERGEANRALCTYIRQHLDQRLADPTDDPTDVLGRQAQRVRAGELTAEQASTNGLLLLVAGHETTSNMIALGVLALLQHSDQLAVVRDTDDPKVLAGAVEELLRYLTISEGPATRVATADLTIGDQVIRKDEGLLFLLPAANHDPRFPHAEDLDITRSATGHVAFGYGVHQCLGQNLARLELRIAIPALLRRLPDLRLAVDPAELRIRPRLVGVDELPVTW